MYLYVRRQKEVLYADFVGLCAILVGSNIIALGSYHDGACYERVTSRKESMHFAVTHNSRGVNTIDPGCARPTFQDQTSRKR